MAYQLPRLHFVYFATGGTAGDVYGTVYNTSLTFGSGGYGATSTYGRGTFIYSGLILYMFYHLSHRYVLEESSLAMRHNL